MDIGKIEAFTRGAAGRRARWWIAFLLALMPLAAAAVPGYLAVTPVSGKYAAAVALNDAGRYAVNNFGPEVPVQPAYIGSATSNEDVGSLGGLITRIGAINNEGEAVGISTTADGALHTFLYSSGRIQDLSAGYGMASVGGINDRGEVAGQSQDLRAMVLKDGRADVFGPANSAAGAINQAGDMLVEYYPEGQASRTCVYSGGACTDLPGFGGRYSVASALNDAGWVTGFGTLPDGRSHAWLYDGNTLADLTPLAVSGAAYDINTLGHVVGSVDNRAFLYADGKLIDLNTLLNQDEGLLLTSAFAINDHEQILANACDRTGVFCYTTVLLNVLPAVPEPSGRAMWMLALGLPLVLRLAGRKASNCP